MDTIGLIETFVLVSLVFIPLERLFSNRAEQKTLRDGWSTDVIHVIVTGTLVQAGHIALIVVLVSTIKLGIPNELRVAVSSQPLWLAVVEILLIADIGFYFMHRLMHAVPFLWRLHSVHHSSEQLDYLAAYRVHPLDQLLVRSLSLIPIFVLGFASEAIVIFGVAYHWQAMLLHSNTRFRFGLLNSVIASPCFHHWHHANGEDAGNCNFAGQLSVIDRIFGTYNIAGGQMPTEYGIDEVVPENYLSQLAYPFRSRTQDNQAVSSLNKV